MALADVITLNISRSAPAVSRQGFGVMLILGSTITTAWGADRIRYYTSAAALLTDGFSSSDPEYKRALAAFSQTNKPARIAVGRRLTSVAQVDTVTPNTTSQTVAHYITTIDGVAYDFTSDVTPTAAEVVTGLIALINADSNCSAVATGTNTLILTSRTAGLGFTTTVSANLTNVHTTAVVGMATDMADISAIDDTWYALCVTSTVDDEVMAAAAYVESVRKIFIYATNAAGVLTTATNDIASRIKAKAYARTAVIYSGDYVSGTAAAWLGGILPLQPGSVTFKFKTLVGITADALTPTQYVNAKAKRANVYTTVGGLGMTEEGVTGSGEFIDVIIGIDWLYANLQADIFQQLMNSAKIPFTDVGAGVLEQAIQNRLRLGVKAGILAESPAPVVTVPKVADISTGDKAIRAFTGITFSAVLAGAVHSVSINGSVTV